MGLLWKICVVLLASCQEQNKLTDNHAAFLGLLRAKEEHRTDRKRKIWWMMQTFVLGKQTEYICVFLFPPCFTPPWFSHSHFGVSVCFLGLESQMKTWKKEQEKGFRWVHRAVSSLSVDMESSRPSLESAASQTTFFLVSNPDQYPAADNRPPVPPNVTSVLEKSVLWLHSFILKTGGIYRRTQLKFHMLNRIKQNVDTKAPMKRCTERREQQMFPDVLTADCQLDVKKRSDSCFLKPRFYSQP